MRLDLTVKLTHIESSACDWISLSSLHVLSHWHVVGSHCQAHTYQVIGLRLDLTVNLTRTESSAYSWISMSTSHISSHWLAAGSHCQPHTYRVISLQQYLTDKLPFGVTVIPTVIEAKIEENSNIFNRNSSLLHLTAL